MAAGDAPDVAQALVGQFGHVEAGGVPGHVGMVPTDEGQPSAVGAGPGRGDEVAGAEQHLPAVPCRSREPDDGVLHVRRIGMVLAHRHEPAVGQGRRVGVPIALGRQGLGLAARLEHVQALVGEVGEPDHAA